MNWLDKAIEAISPSWAYTRALWRAAYNLQRNYDAGGYDRLNASWRARGGSAQSIDQRDRTTLRNRARDLERNSDIMEGLLQAIERNVVGSGIKLQAKTDNEELNKELERLWVQWCKPRNCDITGQQSLMEICRMIIRRRRVDGGILIVKAMTSGGIVPFCLQVLEVDSLDCSRMEPKKKNNRVIDGVEVNQYGKHMGYWIHQTSPDGVLPMDSLYVEASNVIFFWYKTRPSAIREVSMMANVMERIRDIGSYLQAVATRERIAACFGLAIKRKVPESTGHMVGRGGLISPEARASGKPRYAGKEITPGMILEMDPGDEIQTVAPTGGSNDAEKLVRMQQRLTGSGQGISYEAVSRDMSQVNYSSARQGLIEDDATYDIERSSLIEHVLSDIYETFVISCFLSGRLDQYIAPTKFWTNKYAYMGHEWIAPARAWIDPLKEARANLIAMQSGQKSFQQLAAESGTDWRELIDDIAAANEYAAEKGVVLGGTLTDVDLAYMDDKEDQDGESN